MGKPIYSNYFTVVIYDEFKRLDKLLELGQIYQSPIHFSKLRHHSRERPNEFGLVEATNEWRLYGAKENKPHQHILIKTPNTYTENTFLVKLMAVLENDITGIAIHKDDCLVKKPQTMLRYFYHLDNPTKEHFNLATAFESVMPCFTKEVVSAFETEITHIITSEIYSGNITSLQDIIQYNSYSLVFEEYLRRSHNLYYVMSVLKDLRYMIKETKENEKFSTIQCNTPQLLENKE